MWQMSQETESRFRSLVRVDELCGFCYSSTARIIPKLILSNQRTTKHTRIEK
jgi:hypothetical protein